MLLSRLQSSLVLVATAIACTVAPNPAQANDIGSLNSPSECPVSTTLKVTIDGKDRGYDPETGEILGAPQTTCVGDDSQDDPVSPRALPTLPGAPDNSTSKTFTSGSTRHDINDANGSFTSQVNYRSSGLPIQWGYRFSPALQRMVAGTVHETTTRTPPNCHSNHPGKPANYHFHGSCSGHKTHTRYSLSSVYVFQVRAGKKVAPATLTYKFNYTIVLV